MKIVSAQRSVARVKRGVGGDRRLNPLVRCGLALLGLLVLPGAAAARMEAGAAASTVMVASASVPAGFSDTAVASVASPTALAFTPDGRLLITTQPGQVRVYQNGQLLAAPALDISARTCPDQERGLVGVAVDPVFAANRFIYLFYTFKKFGVCENNTARSPVNRVSRFTLSDSNVIDPASEVVLVDGIPSPQGVHNGGDLKFAKDGYLYISVGDGGCDYAGDSGCFALNDASRDLHALVGKILRVTSTGAIPPTNPFTGSDSVRCSPAGRTDPGKKCQETFAWGLRNPFRLGFDPNSAGTRFFINDVGERTWEEIDLGQAGADYGWNVREGPCAKGSTTNCGAPSAGMTNPIYSYPHSSGCSAVTGGAFVPAGIWPAEFDGAYLYSDFTCGTIFRLTQSGGSYTASVFMTGLGAPTTLVFGPSASGQALYYAGYGTESGGGGEIHRVEYTGGGNRAPTAAMTASPTYGALPLTVSFNGSASSDPDGDTLTYVWYFGDLSRHRQTTTPTTSYTYSKAGTYYAELYVQDPSGARSPVVRVRIDPGNTAPTPQISSPASTARFAVGQTITLSGSATDPEDGALPSSALRWEVIRVHGDHTHPYLQPTAGNSIQITGPTPEDLFTTTTSYLKIMLTATDSKGVSSTIVRDLLPNIVDVTLASQPSGATFQVNGSSYPTPTTLKSWEAYQLNVAAPAQIVSAGQTLPFDKWSDGVTTATRVINTPATAATYTALYQGQATTGTGLTGQYFDNWTFSALKFSRTDAVINFDWGTGSPAASIAPDTFSILWTGQIQPRYSELYTFVANLDNGLKVWVNNQLVIDRWTNTGSVQDQGSISLQAGVKYPIRIEYVEYSGRANVRLSWSSASQPLEVVPQSQLYP